MTRIVCNFALLGLAVDATSHYSKPPCQSDEVELQIKDYETNYTGKVCAPACGDDDSCPTDTPQFVSVHPKCLLHDSGKKYCGLKCFVGCGRPTGLTCMRVDKTTRVCTYREKPTPPTPPTPPKDKPCCQGHCADSSKAKYYSIAKSLFGKKHCGECCMDPKKYDLYHFFESNLTKADNDSPCKAFGYTTYDSTDTHGFGPVSMTLDLYNLPTDSIEQAMPTVSASNVRSNVSFCGIISKHLPKECDCKDKPKGGITSCHVTVLNDTIGIAVDIAPCDSTAHMSLLITESEHGIAYPIENIQAGDVQQFPIPHLSFAIPGVNGTVSLEAAASIDGNPDHLTVKAGFNACGVVMGHAVCGSQLTSLLPIWALHHTFELGGFCESTKLSFDVIV